MGLFDDIGNAVGNAVGDIVGAVGGVIKTAAGDLEDAVQIAENVFSGYIQGVGKVLLSEGVIILYVISNVELLFAELIQNAIGVRPLRPNEMSVAQEVFRGTVPLDRVVLASLDGIGGRPFTIPGSMIATLALLLPAIGPLLAVATVVGDLADKYIIFIGPNGYRDANNFDSAPSGATFIHELTHVWQGHHGAFPWTYVADSAAMQCTLGGGHGHDGAYYYVPGDQWSNYHAEQQAMIVEDWYCHRGNPTKYPLPPDGIPLPPQFDTSSSPFLGSVEVDSLHHHPSIIDVYQAYIDCNVRRGQPWAPTVFPQLDISVSDLAKMITPDRKPRQGPLTLNPFFANRNLLTAAPFRRRPHRWR
jgi:hypothetical protein